MVKKLDLDLSIMERLSHKSIRKLPARKNVRYGQEAVVTFESAADRDMVKGSGFKLAGDPNSSIRLEIPSHLLSLHRVLGAAAQKLRAVHTCKTNIKFEDETRELVLDYKIGDKPWARLKGDEARKISAAATNVLKETSSEDFQKLLEKTPLTGANADPVNSV